MLHIQQLDGKHVGRMFQFFLGHDEGRRILLTTPPLHYGRDGGQPGKRSIAQDAKQVEIGEIRLVLAGCGRAVENYALKVLGPRLALCG